MPRRFDADPGRVRQERRRSGSPAFARPPDGWYRRPSPSGPPVFKRFLKPETRYARRMARIARFERPIAGPGSRIMAWANMLLVDHGVFRLAYLNRHRVGVGQVWRSAQPGPHQLARFRAEGVRTVISLRGGARARLLAAAAGGLRAPRAHPGRVRPALPGGPGQGHDPRRETVLRGDRVPGGDALQVGRRPGGPRRRTLPHPARGAAGGRGGAPALRPLRPFPLRQDRHPRRLLRPLPRRG